MAEVSVTLPDGSVVTAEPGTTVAEFAYHIGPGLGDDAVAGVVDGELVDTATPLTEDVELRIVTAGSDTYRDVLRHSAAHVLAQAIQRLHPEAKFAIGPWTDEGFYYDVANVDLDEEDLEAIEAEAREIIEADLPIERFERPREEAFEVYADNRFKREILETEAAGEDPVSFYRQDGFEDLCKGPHVESTGDIGGLAVLDVSGAYWRGEEEEEMLTRVHGTAFESEAELEAFLERRREAEKRDHRRIGREMDLFSVPAHSPGCVHFHPNGMTIRRELEDYIRVKNDELGYDEVWTPELNKAELWEQSGHLEFFGDEGEFFLWEVDGERYGLKPMNCANHAYIFDSERRSYRELPFRLSEFGTVYRNEQSGELSGLLRVRGFTQDDGHAFITEDQIKEEVLATVAVIIEIVEQFGFDVSLKVETEPENSQGPPELWRKAEQALQDALDEGGFAYEVEEGEGSFYGPKVAIDAEDAIGREWTIGTVQLDFVIPRNYGLSYVGEDNEEHTPVMVHRALLGSIERFMGVMIEHFAGDFPLWLAPEQVRIIPISDDNVAYAESIREQLAGFRVTIADTDRTLGRRIRAGHDDRVPYMVVVGGDEAESGTISVRDREEREAGDVDPDAFREHLRRAVDSKSTEVGFLAE